MSKLASTDRKDLSEPGFENTFSIKPTVLKTKALKTFFKTIAPPCVMTDGVRDKTFEDTPANLIYCEPSLTRN